jgi:hypothetical protein
MIGRVEEEAKDREEKIAALGKQQAEFWEREWEPARKKIVEAIDKSPGRESHVDPGYSVDPTRSLRVLDRQHDVTEFVFNLKIIRDDLKLFVEFNDDEKKYPLEEITDSHIYDAFLDRYENFLREKLIPK